MSTAHLERHQVLLRLWPRAGAPGVTSMCHVAQHAQYAQKRQAELIAELRQRPALPPHVIAPTQRFEQPRRWDLLPSASRRVVMEDVASVDECSTLIRALRSALEDESGPERQIPPLIDAAEPLIGAGAQALAHALTARIQDRLEAEWERPLSLAGSLLSWIEGSPTHAGAASALSYAVPHVDRANVAEYHVSSILYLSSMATHGRPGAGPAEGAAAAGVGSAGGGGGDARAEPPPLASFSGGEFAFHDADADRLVLPRAGRLLAFDSGERNLHAVLPVLGGHRFALAVWFNDGAGGVAGDRACRRADATAPSVAAAERSGGGGSLAAVEAGSASGQGQGGGLGGRGGRGAGRAAQGRPGALARDDGQASGRSARTLLPIAGCAAAALGACALSIEVPGEQPEGDERAAIERLPDLASAQGSRVVHIPRALSDAEVDSLLERAHAIRRAGAGRFARDAHGVPLLGDAPWETTYLHSDGRFAREMPELRARLCELALRADEAGGWGLLRAARAEAGAEVALVAAGSAEPDGQTPADAVVRLRTVELHEVRRDGALDDPEHFDGGSLVTIDIMLSSPGVDFNGGAFGTLEADGSVHEHAEFRRGDALCFVSHKRHCVRPVTDGVRRVLVAELWEGPERTCGHRCRERVGDCGYSASTAVAEHLVRAAQPPVDPY